MPNLKRALFGIAAVIITSALITPASADPPVPGTCTYSNGVVSGVDLPTDAVINFFVTDASGRTGWIYGYAASDGTAWQDVSAPTTPTTYDFGSVTRGPSDDYKFWVYAECTGG